MIHNYLPEHPPHANIAYGEIPKSCTMDNRQNLVEHQIYATIQRKQPPIPPFGAAGQVPLQAAPKGTFSGTLDRLKLLKPRRSVSHPHDDLVPETSADICPYATSGGGPRFHHLHHNNLRSTVTPGASRCATLGRIKTLEMTEYQKDKLLNEANTVKIKV